MLVPCQAAKSGTWKPLDVYEYVKWPCVTQIFMEMISLVNFRRTRRQIPSWILEISQSTSPHLALSFRNMSEGDEDLPA